MDSRCGFCRWTVSVIVVLTVLVVTVHSSVPDEGCAADELQCLDGSCYHKSYVCDEMRDCPYAEDEASCWGPYWVSTSPGWAYDATPTDSPETSGPGKVLDLDDNTFWSPSGPGPWYIIFHLPATLKLFRIGIKNYGDKVHDVSAFKFQRSDHDNPYNWVDLITFNQPIETVPNSFWVRGIGTPGRYWRLFITATGPDNSPPWLREVEFYGMDPGPWWVYNSQDWAIDATPTDEPDTSGPDKVLDYLTDTFWKPSSPGPWYIVFDLLAPHTLSSIFIFNYGDVTHDITAFKFQTSTSNDPYNWTDVVAFDESSSNLPDDFVVGGFTATSRYWRLFITATGPDNSPPWPRDVEFYGMEIVCPAETDRPCLDGSCIPATRWCDGTPGDCPNDEDETDCEDVLEDDTTEMVDVTTVTEALTTVGDHNGTMHAGKMTTEEQPGLATPPGGTTSTAAPTTIDDGGCAADELPCYDGSCFLDILQCDLINDCKYAEDEANCWGPTWVDKFPDWAYDATPTDSPETSGPGEVLDYDHNTFWSPSGPGPWYIIFHLQVTLKLFRIGITNYGDKVHDVSAFKFQRSDHDNPYNWVDWITFSQPIETVLNSFTVPGIGTPGRYWRLFITATGPDNSPPWLRDVGFYGMDPGPWWVYNSQDWEIDATPTVWPDTNGPDKVLDYVKDTFWKPSGTGPWYIIFDLLTPHTLSNIAIRNYGDVSHDITAFTFQTSASNDPYNWTDVVAFEESSSLLPDDFPIVGGFTATSRYWRLFITATGPDNSPPWLREVELYGIEIVCPAETDRPCLDGLCIPATRWCDDIPGDCLNDEDETDCEDVLEVGDCPDGMHKCSSGKCIPPSFWCDGSFNDCEDGEDEANCGGDGGDDIITTTEMADVTTVTEALTTTEDHNDTIHADGMTTEGQPDLATSPGGLTTEEQPDLATPSGGLTTEEQPDLATPPGGLTTEEQSDLATPPGGLTIEGQPDLATPPSGITTEEQLDLTMPPGGTTSTAALTTTDDSGATAATIGGGVLTSTVLAHVILAYYNMFA